MSASSSNSGSNNSISKEAHHTDTYITYEVWYPDQRTKQVLKTETRKITVPGEIRGWRVGTFPTAAGREIHGVKLIYGEPKSSELVAVPDEAVNVQLHVGRLPKDLREGPVKPPV